MAPKPSLVSCSGDAKYRRKIYYYATDAKLRMPTFRIPLPPGTDIRFSNPTEHDAYAPFVKNHLRPSPRGSGSLTSWSRAT